MTVRDTECVNCGRESHFLDTFCWWGVWVLLLPLLAVLGFISYTIYVLVNA